MAKKPTKKKSTKSTKEKQVQLSLINDIAKLAETSKRHQAKHILVKALAGTGKTFSSIMGVAWAVLKDRWDEVVEHYAFHKGIKEFKKFKIEPSKEQSAIWNCMAQDASTWNYVIYCAFNKSIVTEFELDWGWLVKILETEGVTLKFATVNSLGNGMLWQRLGRTRPDKGAEAEILARLTGKSIYELRRESKETTALTLRLVELAKLTLPGWKDGEVYDVGTATTDELLHEIIDTYDIEVQCRATQLTSCFDLVRKVLVKSLDPSTNGNLVSFNDQNWLPVVLGMKPARQAGMVLVDEAQDLPRCKQEFVMKLGNRFMVVGDVNQAIYAFAGADPASLPRLEARLANTSRGIEICTLNETRRCGRAIVKEANEYVPALSAHETNPPGSVQHIDQKALIKMADSRDMVLGRMNAPLVSVAIKFIASGKKAVIRGRNFGDKLLNILEKLRLQDTATSAEVAEAAGIWHNNEINVEMAKRNPSDTRIAVIDDTRDCIEALAVNSENLAGIKLYISRLFSGLKCDLCKKTYDEEVKICPACNVSCTRPEGIQVSSLHRAKGLEAVRVFFLNNKACPCPHPAAKQPSQRLQERNLLYIGITRAKHELVWVK